jgi:hypothetical protein
LADGDTLILPAGSATWSTPFLASTYASITIKGAGTTATGGGDVTTLTDGVTNGGVTFNWHGTSNATYRVTGITFRINESNKNNSGLAFGDMSSLRFDHCHVVSATTIQEQTMNIGAGVFGVMDHNIFDLTGLNAIYVLNGRSSGGDSHAHLEWKNATNFGGSDYLFLEDNIINGASIDGISYGTRLLDTFLGAKVVVRFNTLHRSCVLETHATGNSGDARGARSREVYGNLADATGPALTNPNFDAVDIGSGTAMVWGNSWDQVYGSGGVYHFNVTRKNDNTYGMGDPATYWGFCGPTPVATGTVTVQSGGTTLLQTAGNTFDTSHWTGANAKMIMLKISGVDKRYYISSVADTTHLTISQSAVGDTVPIPGAPLTGISYWVASNWDGNTDTLGYPCLDQPGRGAGDLISGSPGSLVADCAAGAGGCVGGTLHWPNQAKEPMYFWNNVGTPISPNTLVGDETGGRVVSDRDYYLPASGIQTNSTTPFNGTTGTGWGTKANRPATCTTGVAYWATDEGSWNTSGSNPQGVQQSGASGNLYQCTATNTWTLSYTPYTYPHPLNTATVSAPVITSGTAAFGTLGVAFSFQIAATNTPTSFCNSTCSNSLPAWASVNTSTGLITGTPNAVATTNATQNATNASGTGSASLAITIGSNLPAPPAKKGPIFKKKGR